MMQKLNDKGQGMAAPPREVSRSAKSTWTGTRAVPSGGAVGLWGRAGALAHSTAMRNRQVSRALGEAAPSRDVFAISCSHQFLPSSSTRMQSEGLGYGKMSQMPTKVHPTKQRRRGAS